MKLKKAYRIYLATVLLWLAAVVAYGVWHIYAVLSGPPDSDLYANSIGFQVVAYMLIWAPRFLGALLCILLIEFVLLGRKTQSKKPV